MLSAAIASGLLFSIIEQGSINGTASITLCLDAVAPLSCQEYPITGSELSIVTTVPQHTYPQAGIKINSSNVSINPLTNCQPLSNGFCQFSVSDSLAATIQLNHTPSNVPASWSAGNLIDSNFINGLSCPSSQFCMAVDSNGDALSYNGSNWSTPTNIDIITSLSDVSCPTTNFCVAIDAAGYAFNYTASTWSQPSAYAQTNSLSNISCPTETFCMVTTNGGMAITYAPNTGVWGMVTTIDPSHSLNAVSCPTDSFCVAVDNAGNSFTYNGSTWSSAVSVTLTNLKSVSCPTADFCVAVDNGGFTYQYTNGAWGNPIPINVPQEFDSISCPSADFCMAVDKIGNAVAYQNGQWMTPVALTSDALYNLSCASSAFCVATSANSAFIYS